ncbi:metalloregulator ArsR/SmtB family transcription factor [Streptomyces sp. 3MP-14]|uniref:Metalloregulator ArsR/SmtB family transcription factor n=1 Tax=Streptomyces mimosae TaxID=2586635 RepID=A0A5N6AGT8_9ACTN|nr:MULTISPECIES: metalloregulator ArsR/SmtB family transcription factor [Streptomyces]KAB8167273.1 metalloregulator ArsR/SmtB family transcription factor [Streptomyces mimosae]KAB8177213.1 metalloregulator ArsR/SmtB family transcription factor [Streptomyces sp. 3MP-14]
MSALDVLADPTRRRIVELLAGGELNATTIAGRFASSRPAISQHLGVLVDGGVLTVRRVGTQRLYRIDPASLAEASDWLSAQAHRWERVLDALESALDEGTG